jgi:hypothetical protein
MNEETRAAGTLVLTDKERRTLLDILEAVQKDTEVELRRTEAFAAQAVVRAKAATLQSLLGKAREAGPARTEARAPAPHRLP